ncbi:MAG: sugar ABC transporter substrate-binding protein [Chloroflexota bacterium]
MKLKNKSLFLLVALLVMVALVSSACAAPDNSAELEAAQQALAEAEAALAEAEDASAEELAEAQAALEAAQAEAEAAMAETEETAAEGPVTLTFWSRDTNATQLQALVDGWNETHDNQIELTLIPAGDFLSKLGVAIAAGEPPDIAAIDSSRIPKFASEGQLLDITDQATALPYFDHFIEADIETVTYPKIGGRLHGIPFFLDNSVLIYNKDLFRQAGLDPERPPANRAEMQEAIEKITALGDDIYGFYFSGACSGCMIFTSAPQVWASGGDFLSEDGSAATLDDPELHELLKFYRWMVTEGHVPASAEGDNGSGWTTLFTAGQIGMQGTNSVGLSSIVNDHPDLDFGTAVWPGREGGTSSWVGGDSITIPADSEHPDEAWEFLKWLSSREAQTTYYTDLNYLPIRTDLFDHPNIANDPNLLTGATAGEVGKVPWMVEMDAAVCCAPTAPTMNFWLGAIFEGDFDFEDEQEEANEIINAGQ